MALPAPLRLSAVASALALSLAAVSFFFARSRPLSAASATFFARLLTVLAAFFAVPCTRVAALRARLATFFPASCAFPATASAVSATVAVTPLPLLIGVVLVWDTGTVPVSGI